MHWIGGSPPNPDLEIGETDEFSLFRVSGVAARDDGGIIVANAGWSTILSFDAGGRLLQSVGRRGRGSGEFEFPVLLAAAGDSLVVFDGQLGRYTKLSRDLEPGRVITPAIALGNPLAYLGNDRVLMSATAVRAGPQTATAVVVDSISYLVANLVTGVADTLRTFAGQQVLISNVDGRISFTSVPFSPRPVATAHGDRVYVTDGARPVIYAFDHDGDHVATMAVAGREAVPLERRTVDEYIENRVAGVSADFAAELRARYGNMPIPREQPAFLSLHADTHGFIWAMEFNRDWLVFDPCGAALGHVEVPHDLRVRWIDDDHLWGASVDEDGVERLRRHRLTRNGDLRAGEACGAGDER